MCPPPPHPCPSKEAAADPTHTEATSTGATSLPDTTAPAPAPTATTALRAEEDEVDNIPAAAPAPTPESEPAAAAATAGVPADALHAEDDVAPLASEADSSDAGRVSPTRQRMVGQQRPGATPKRTTNQLLWVQHKLMPRLLDHPQSFAFHRPVVEQIPALVDSYPKVGGCP